MQSLKYNVYLEFKDIKKAYPEIPPRVEYSLTELGLKTLPIIDQIVAFGLENLV